MKNPGSCGHWPRRVECTTCNRLSLEESDDVFTCEAARVVSVEILDPMAAASLMPEAR